MRKPDYVKLWDSLIEPHLVPANTHLHCNRCGNSTYVSEEEMQFLMDTQNIIHNEVRTPHIKSNLHRDTPLDAIAIYYTVEYVYVGAFCPQCNRKKFGKLSNWRE